MFGLNVSFYLCDTVSFLRIMYFIKLFLNIIRFVVPIIVICMIILDLVRNVINPNDKEGMKKIINRVVAAIVVFLVPTFINLVVHLISYIEVASDSDTDYKASRCYTNGTLECVEKVENYLNCDGYEGEEQDKCKTFRQCNSYVLSNGCQIATERDDKNCKTINLDKDNEFKSDNTAYTKFTVTEFAPVD